MMIDKHVIINRIREVFRPKTCCLFLSSPIKIYFFVFFPLLFYLVCVFTFALLAKLFTLSLSISPVLKS